MYELAFDKLTTAAVVFKPKEGGETENREMTYEALDYPKIKVKMDNDEGTLVQRLKAGSASKTMNFVDDSKSKDGRSTMLMKKEINRDRLPIARVCLKDEEGGTIIKIMQREETRWRDQN